MSTKYSENDIERYAGLAGIRKRPTRFIGSNDSNGLFTCIREPLDNCCDLALAGINDTAHLVLDGDSYWVLDNGPGIPVGKKEFTDERGRTEKLSVLFVVTGLTNAGKNFNSDTISRGAHGEGLKCTNAMSKQFQVWTYREGKWWTIEYRDAKIYKDVALGRPPKLPHGLTATKGTLVKFTPDLSLFAKGTKLSLADVRSWCELTSILIPGFTVKFTDAKGKTRVLKSKNGVKDYLAKRVADTKCDLLGNAVFHVNNKTVDVVLGFSDSDKATVDGYTNGLTNKDGGEHVRALYAALDKSLLPYKGRSVYTPSDLRDGLMGLVNAKLSTPRFINQTKDKLLDERGYDLIYPELLAAFADFWKKHKSLAKAVSTRASDLRNLTADFLKDKKLAKQIKTAKATLHTKLAGIAGNAPVSERELYVVEGDSAGGGLKRIRDRTRQAIFPLKGKPLNVMDATKDVINKNDELSMFLAALGVDTATGKATIPYGKIIFVADPDPDGYHINSLLLGAIYRFLPQAFAQRLVYVLRAPLYKATYKGKTYFGMTKADVHKQCGNDKVHTGYLKGWGEVSEEDLFIILEADHQKLHCVVPNTERKDNKILEQLLGKDAGYRKQLFGVK
jgi:DNA gyrase/topoisomerase IV subunit B